MITLILAVSKNGVVGVDNKLPWRLLDDLDNFKNTTINNPVVMGSNTFRSLPFVLPQRQNIIVTSNPKQNYCNVSFFANLQEVQDKYPEYYLIGGAKLATSALNQRIVDRLLITHVDATLDTRDAALIDIDYSDWKLVSSKAFDKSHRNSYAFTICEYIR